MNKKTILIIVVIIIFAAIIFLVNFLADRDKKEIKKGFFLEDGPIICNFVLHYFATGEEAKIDVYIKEGNRRIFSDRSWPLEGGEALLKDNNYYFWKEEDSAGIKLPEKDMPFQIFPFDIEENKDIDDIYQFNCEKITIEDDLMFDIPENIEFFELPTDDLFHDKYREYVMDIDIDERDGHSIFEYDEYFILEEFSLELYYNILYGMLDSNY